MYSPENSLLQTETFIYNVSHIEESFYALKLFIFYKLKRNSSDYHRNK